MSSGYIDRIKHKVAEKRTKISSGKAFSQSRRQMPQSADDSAVEDVSAALANTGPANRSSLLEEITSKWKSTSTLLALGQNKFACDIHENCDGTCEGSFSQNTPFISPETTLFSLLSAAASPQKQNATREEGPHDMTWMKARNFSNLTYNDIDSSTGEIRLLKLQKGIFRSDVVECEMITTSLDSPCEYNALSYNWGPGGASEVMLVDGRKHSIYGSLNSALKAYREGPLHDLPLWIDAVSINQENKTEKSQQILLMRQIYSKAATVFVYLDAAERSWFAGLDLAFLLSLMHDYSKTAKDKVIDIMYDILPDFQHPSWSKYLEIFLAPWFRRTWILQEIVLSKNARICRGQGAVDWQIIEDSQTFFWESGLSMHYPKMSLRNIDVPKAMVNARRMMQIKEIAWSQEETSLMQILSMTRHFEASDPRDKVLGLLGLLKELPEGLDTIVDYNLSVDQISLRVAAHFVQSGIPNRVLDQAGLQRQAPASKMPSWVPDWNIPSLEAIRPLTTFRMTTFNATGLVTPLLGLLEEAEKLAGPGFHYHTVTRMSDIKSSSGQPLDAWGRLRAAKRCYDEGKNYVYDDADEAFARTLLIDDLHTGRNAAPGVSPIHNLMPTFRTVMNYLDRRDRASKNENVQLSKGATPDQVESYLFQANATFVGRRFAVTDTGYMALVAERTEVGDAVAFLLGTPVPYTIRLDMTTKKEAGEYSEIEARLIGDCYMHEMMEGEVLEDAGSRGLKPSITVLV